MKAVVLRDSKLRFETEYQSCPPADCIEIAVLQAGICETDLQLIQGYMDFAGVLGHEFVGIAQSGRYIGQRVAGEINCACGTCRYCLAGLPNHCPQRTVLGILNHDGAFAETVWLPEKNLHTIPDAVSNDAAVFVEPLAAAYQILEQVDLSSYCRIVVLGDGRLGNLCAQVIRKALCSSGGSPPPSILVVGKHAEKLSRLKKLGIETRLLTEMNESHCADLVVDCTGSPGGLETALQLLEPRGTLVLKSTYAGRGGPNLAAVVINELTVIGSRCGPFEKAIQALTRQEIEVQSLITSRFPLQNAIEAFAMAQQKDQLKVILNVSE